MKTLNLPRTFHTGTAWLSYCPHTWVPTSNTPTNDSRTELFGKEREEDVRGKGKGGEVTGKGEEERKIREIIRKMTF